MTTTAIAGVPTARAWRARVRRARRAHHGRSTGELLTDLYMLLWLVVVYGGALTAVVRRHLRSAAHATVTAEPYWLGAAVLLMVAGLVWQGARALGPLMATQAERAWAVSTPLDRRAWLLPRFLAFLLAGVAGGTVAAGTVAMVGAHSSGPGLAALAGGLLGAALVTWSVVAQGTPGGGARWRTVGVLGTGAGVVAAAAVVAAHFTGTPLPGTGLPVAPSLAVAGLPLAGLGLVASVRTLPRLDVAALSAGAQLAAATMTATLSLDPSLLSGVMEARRWRRVGRVRSRPFHPLGGRIGVLLQAELRRVLRRPGALAVWVVLGLAQYAVAVVAPSAAGVIRVVVAYFAANRLAGGLRAVGRSPGLRRAIGGREIQLRLAHLVIPALGTALWWLLTIPAGGGAPGSLDPVLVMGVVAASYRAGTRPPMSYAGTVVETPFGLVPVDLILELARGPDLLAAVVLARLLFGG